MSSIIWSDFRYKGLEIKDHIGIPTAGTLRCVRWSVIRQCPTNSNFSTAHNPQFHTLHAHLHHGQLELGLKKPAQIPQRCLKCLQVFLGHNVQFVLYTTVKKKSENISQPRDSKLRAQLILCTNGWSRIWDKLKAFRDVIRSFYSCYVGTFWHRAVSVLTLPPEILSSLLHHPYACT
jgi:hypothetical protein